MTREKMLSISDILWKVAVPVFLALCSWTLNQASSELSELKADIKAMRAEYQAKLEAMAVEVAMLKTRVDYHESKKQ